jgi:phage terminase small subunit
MTSPQELRWLNEYFLCWNATEAARRADYKWPNKVGPAKKLKFADEINQRLEENTMEANEALSRLSDMARGDLADFANVEDLRDLAGHSKSHVIKKIKKTVKHFKSGETATYIEIELNDPQSALEKIGKHLGLWTDKVQHSGSIDVTGLTDEERIEQISALLDRARERADRQSNSGD